MVKVVREQWRSILLIIILRFAESAPFSASYRLRGFRRQRSLGQASPDYSVHCNVHLSAGVSHARAIWHHVGRRGCRQVYIFGALFCRGNGFSLFWLLESRSLILMTMGYVLLLTLVIIH